MSIEAILGRLDAVHHSGQITISRQQHECRVGSGTCHVLECLQTVVIQHGNVVIAMSFTRSFIDVAKGRNPAVILINDCQQIMQGYLERMVISKLIDEGGDTEFTMVARTVIIYRLGVDKGKRTAIMDRGCSGEV